VQLALEVKSRHEQQSDSQHPEEKQRLEDEIITFFSQKIQGILNGEDYEMLAPPLSSPKGILLPLSSSHQEQSLKPSSSLADHQHHFPIIAGVSSSSDIGVNNPASRDYGLLPKFRLALDAILGPQLKPNKSRFRDCLSVLQVIQNDPNISYKHTEGGMICNVKSSNLIDCVKALLNSGFKNPDQNLLNSIRSGRVMPHVIKAVPGLQQLVSALTKSYLGGNVIKDLCIRAFFEHCRSTNVHSQLVVKDIKDTDKKDMLDKKYIIPHKKVNVHKKWVSITR
jgi:hypothetical protein